MSDATVCACEDHREIYSPGKSQPTCGTCGLPARTSRPAHESTPSRHVSIVTIVYTNWRGETAERHILPGRIAWGVTEYHTEPQWLLYAFDADKLMHRVFAMADIQRWSKP